MAHFYFNFGRGVKFKFIHDCIEAIDKHEFIRMKQLERIFVILSVVLYEQNVRTWVLI